MRQMNGCACMTQGFWVSVLGLGLLAASSVEADGIWDLGPVWKTHAEHQTLRTSADEPVHNVVSRTRIAAAEQELDRPVVYGYLPYWEFDYSGFQWDLLTHLAYFSAELEVDGSVSDSHQWTTTGMAELMDEAQSAGVQVVLSVTNFENDEIGILCNDPLLRTKSIETLLDLVQQMGGDGINIDFEFVPYEAKQGFVLFMQELTERFHEEIPGSHVSYAGPCVDWSGAYDYDELRDACDAVFVMGYCYHPQGSIAGPLAPIEGGDVWWSKHLTSTLGEYTLWGGEEIRGKLIMGYPLYGRSYTIEEPGIPATFVGDDSLIIARNIPELSEDAPWILEEYSKSTYQEFSPAPGVWTQRWLDTAESHSYKFQFACDEALAGVGFWALGYDGVNDPIWDALRDVQENCAQWTLEPNGDSDAWMEDGTDAEAGVGVGDTSETENSETSLGEEAQGNGSGNPGAAQPQRGGREIAGSDLDRSRESDEEGASPPFSVSIGEESGSEPYSVNNSSATIQVEEGARSNGCNHGSKRMGLGLIFALFWFRNLRPAVRWRYPQR